MKVLFEKLIEKTVDWLVNLAGFKMFLSVILTTLLAFFHQFIKAAININWCFFFICFAIDFYLINFWLTRCISDIKEQGLEKVQAIDLTLKNTELFNLVEESLKIVEDYNKVRDERDAANGLLLEIYIPDPTPYELEEREKVQISKVQEIIRERIREFYASKTWVSSKTFDLFIKKEIQHQKEQNDKLRLETWGMS